MVYSIERRADTRPKGRPRKRWNARWTSESLETREEKLEQVNGL